MRLLNCWVRTLIASFFCLAFVPSYALAADEMLGGPKAKTEALASSDAQLDAELADINARIDELEAVIAKAEAQVAAAQKAEVAKMNARIDAINSEIAKLVVEIATTEEAFARSETVLRPVELDVTPIKSLVAERSRLESAIANASAQIVTTQQAVTKTPVPSKEVAPAQITLVKYILLDRHTPSLYRHWQRQDTIYKRANPWGDDYCRSVQVRGGAGHACDATIWRHLSRGTVISVPAGAVFVKLPLGVKAPETIALSPTEDSGFFALDVNAPVVTAHEQTLANEITGLRNEIARLQTQKNGALLAVFVFLGLLFFVLMALAREHGAKSRIAHEKDMEIARLKNAVDEILGIATKSFEAEYHPEKVAREHGTPDTPVPSEGNSTK